MTNVSDSDHRQLIDSMMQLLSQSDMPVDQQWVERMSECFPCFTLPQMLMLQRDRDLSEDVRARILERLALTVTDKQAFLEHVDMAAAERSRFYPDESRQPKMTTDGVIDTFLRHYGSSSPEEDALLEKLIFNPVAEYAGVLESESSGFSEPADEQDRMIDAFLASSSRSAVPSSRQDETAEDILPEEEQDETAEVERSAENTSRPGLLSESLAIIFIKQRRYAKAYEILLNLSLNYPEKSIYFADQLRFLQKLIINQSHNQKEQS